MRAVAPGVPDVRPDVPGGGHRVLAARPGDDAEDAEIRALLREDAMDGAIRLALTREPRFEVAAEVEGVRHHTVVVRDAATRRLLGMGTRSVREVFHGGEPALLGYLGQLRAAPGVRHIRRTRDGFAHLARTVRPDELPFDLTAIVSDNEPARRLLERGLPGLPVYRPLAEVETLILPTADPVWRRARAPAARRAGELRGVIGFLQAELRRYALAPRWTEAHVRERCRDLAVEHFMVLEDRGELRGVGAVWDQRAFKQVVVTGYQPWLARVRGPLNAALRIAGQPALPPAGTSLALGYLSHFAMRDDGDVEGAIALVDGLRRQARERGLAQLVLTLVVDHPLRAALRRRFAARPYRSILYAVFWPGRAARGADGAGMASGASGASSASSDSILGGRRLYVEAATL
jgi:hypothetical protein